MTPAPAPVVVALLDHIRHVVDGLDEPARAAAIDMVRMHAVALAAEPAPVAS